MKTNKIPAQSAPPATDHPVGASKPFSMRPLFSLVDPPAPLLQHQPLFRSYKLGELKECLNHLEAAGKQKKKNKPCGAKQKKEPVDLTVSVRGNADPLREQIRLLELLNTPEDGLTLLKWDFEQADAHQAELIYLLATAGEKEAFESFSRKTQDYFWHLKRLASDGHEGALRSLATMAIEATDVVNRHVVGKPEMFKLVASERSHWPFLKSLNKQLNQIKTKDEDDLLRKLHSGEATQQDIIPGNRYNPANPTTFVAQRLKDYTDAMRGLAKQIFRENLPARPQPVEGPLDLLILAGHLPNLAQASKAAEDWWELAQQFLLESYPALDPKSTDGLSAIAPMLLKISKVAGIKKRRRRILYNLERAFMTILAKPPGTMRISS